MANNALYFPYIDLPQNRFTNTALPYWDKIITITPWGTEFELKAENENDLLIRGGAVKPIHPEEYSYQYPNFGRNFTKLIDGIHLERLYPKGWAATADAEKTASRVHTAKVLTPDLCRTLLERRLLIEPEGPWLLVEPITADLFMHYLSQCLAQDASLDCFPVTDEPFDPRKIAARDVSKKPHTDDHFRILDRLLPTTADLLSAKQILEIRGRHHKTRLNFRESIETFINEELSQIPNARDRDAQIDNFVIRKGEEIREIQRQLRDYSRTAPTRITFAALGFMTAALAAIDLLHGGGGIFVGGRGGPRRHGFWRNDDLRR
jgi:hypothetical protein